MECFGEYGHVPIHMYIYVLHACVQVRNSIDDMQFTCFEVRQEEVAHKSQFRVKAAYQDATPIQGLAYSNMVTTQTV